MPTTVHIPSTLLQAVDARAKYLRLSRNRFITDALRQVLEDRSAWTPGFIETLAEPWDDPGAIDEMLASIKSARKSKKAPKL